MIEADIFAGSGRMSLEHVDDIVDWHHQFGLTLRFDHAEGSVAMNGLNGSLVTELLRLARLGLIVEGHSRDRKAAARAYVGEAEVAWQKRIR